MVNISIENEVLTVKECYTFNEKGITYSAKYKEGVITALGNEKGFYKWTFPTFKFMRENPDTLVFNSGIEPLKLTKTTVKMPDFTYSKPKNNN